MTSDSADGGGRAALLARLSRIFNEAVMGFLSLVAVATALGPLVFDLGPGMECALMVLEWALVTAFATELAILGAMAPDWRVWIRSPWRIVDAVTVLGPVIALLPQVSDFARGSLMLRVLRVGRAVAFGTRAGSAAVRTPRAASQFMRATTPTVSVVSVDGEGAPLSADWEGFLVWTREPGASWFHASDLSQQHFTELAEHAGVSKADLDLTLRENGHARLREGARHAT